MPIPGRIRQVFLHPAGHPEHGRKQVGVGALGDRRDGRDLSWLCKQTVGCIPHARQAGLGAVVQLHALAGPVRIRIILPTPVQTQRSGQHPIECSLVPGGPAWGVDNHGGSGGDAGNAHPQNAFTPSTTRAAA